MEMLDMTPEEVGQICRSKKAVGQKMARQADNGLRVSISRSADRWPMLVPGTHMRGREAAMKPPCHIHVAAD